MTSYLSSLLTSTTSRYNNLRRSLLSDETDGDVEEDSHISRVLRAYYVERGQPFPAWLGPDPSASRPSTSLYSQVSGRQPAQQSSTRRTGGLSDLWDSSSQPSQPQQPTSLRRSGPTTASRTATPTSMGAPLDHYKTTEPYSARTTRPTLIGARTAPNQHNGSYQPVASESARSSVTGSIGASSPVIGGNTTQDKLKAKLWGAGRTSGTSRGPT